MSTDDTIHFTLNDISIGAEQFDSQALLKAWSWLVPAQLEPLFVTIFGDAFMSDPESGAVYFLDTIDGYLEQVADSFEDFEQLLTEDEEFVRDYFSVLTWLRYRDEILGADAMPKGMIFNYITPFALGGEVEADNIALFPIQAHFDMSGEFWEQLQGLEQELSQEIAAEERDE